MAVASRGAACERRADRVAGRGVDQAGAARRARRRAVGRFGTGRPSGISTSSVERTSESDTPPGREAPVQPCLQLGPCQRGRVASEVSSSSHQPSPRSRA